MLLMVSRRCVVSEFQTGNWNQHPIKDAIIILNVYPYYFRVSVYSKVLMLSTNVPEYHVRFCPRVLATHSAMPSQGARVSL